MSAGTKQGRLQQLLEPVVNAMGCELWGIEFSSSHHSILRIYIDKEGGVQMEDCSRVSRQISSVLDVEDPINTKFTLEVSSPGVDRPLYNLDQFTRFVGEMIALVLKVPYEGRRKYTGLLAGVEGEDVILQLGDQQYLFPVETIDKANVVPRFDSEIQEAQK